MEPNVANFLYRITGVVQLLLVTVTMTLLGLCIKDSIENPISLEDEFDEEGDMDADVEGRSSNYV